MPRIYRFLLLVTAFVTIGPTFSQDGLSRYERDIDSLLSMEFGKERFLQAITFSLIYREKMEGQALFFLDEAVLVADSMERNGEDIKRYRGILLFTKGNIFYAAQKYQDALREFGHLFIYHPEELLLRSQAYNTAGLIHRKLGDNHQAIIHCDSSIAVAYRLNNTNLAYQARSNSSIAYARLGMLAVGLEMAVLAHSELLDYYREQPVDRWAKHLGASLNNVGRHYRLNHQYDSAYHYLSSALLVKEDLQHLSGVVSVNINLAEYYIDLELPDSAWFHLQRADTVLSQITTKDSILLRGDFHHVMGRFYMIEMNDSAGLHLNAARMIFESDHDRAYETEDVLRLLGEYEAKRGNLVRALENEKKKNEAIESRFVKIQDSLILLFPQRLVIPYSEQVHEQEQYQEEENPSSNRTEIHPPKESESSLVSSVIAAVLSFLIAAILLLWYGYWRSLISLFRKGHGAEATFIEYPTVEKNPLQEFLDVIPKEYHAHALHAHEVLRAISPETSFREYLTQEYEVVKRATANTPNPITVPFYQISHVTRKNSKTRWTIAGMQEVIKSEQFDRFYSRDANNPHGKIAPPFFFQVGQSSIVNPTKIRRVKWGSPKKDGGKFIMDDEKPVEFTMKYVNQYPTLATYIKNMA